MVIFYFLFLLTLNILLFYNNSFLAKKLNIFDKPDKIRKFHINKTPITGGLIIYLNIIVYFIFSYFGKIEEIKLFNEKELSFFVLTTSLIFFLGLLDDKINISANKKFLLIFVIILPSIVNQDLLIIDNIKISILEDSFSIGAYGIFWTILCFLLLLNAINMFDGINLQVGIYSLVVIIFFINNFHYHLFFVTILISIFCYLFLNFRNQSFLGDGGTYLLAYLFGYFFIKSYNQEIVIDADEIVLFMILPGLDLMRLFIVRGLSKKNPFNSDNNHLHHLLLRKYNFKKTTLIIQSIIIVPIFLNSFIFYSPALYLILVLFIYLFIILKSH